MIFVNTKNRLIYSSVIGEIYFTNVDLIQKNIYAVIWLIVISIAVSALSWTYSFNNISG